MSGRARGLVLGSVLFAVASFWEGVDVPGESLSLVIMDKLPFEVPTDPVVKARMQRIEEQGGRPFFSFQIPRAIFTLRQGAGRPIATHTAWISGLCCKAKPSWWTTCKAAVSSAQARA